MEISRKRITLSIVAAICLSLTVSAQTPQQITAWNINGVIYVDGVKYPLSFPGLQ
jgi:hypothetical protein